MRLDEKRLGEYVSDWEIDEIRDELSSGVAPDIVAFRHGIPSSLLPRGKDCKGVQDHSSYRLWTEAERAFVRDNYPSHRTRDWSGWKFLGRSWYSIGNMAHKLGVTRPVNGRWDEEEVGFIAKNFPSHGREWPGWGILNRTWMAIKTKAKELGLRREKI